MSIMGGSSIRRLKDCPVVLGLHSVSPVGRRITVGASAAAAYGQRAGRGTQRGAWSHAWLHRQQIICS